MSAVVRLAKDPLEHHDVDQPTSECLLMAFFHEKPGYSRRPAPAAQVCKIRPVQGGGEDTNKCVMTSHTELRSHFRGDTVSRRTAQSYNGRARTRECADSGSGDDAKQARESTFHARSRTRSGEVLRRWRQARGEKRKFVNKSDGEETMPAEVDVEKKGLDRKTNHQPRRSQGRQS